MALQYWQAKGEKRQRMLALRHSYHGDTLAAISVCDPQNAMHSLYRGYMTENLFASVPQCQVNSGQNDEKLFDHWRKDDINEFGTLIEQHASEIAAVILEPIVQGAGGMLFYHPNYLKQVRALCDT